MEEKLAVARLKQGDLTGLEALVRQHQALAVHTAYLIVGDRPLAEDIVQSAFLRAAEKIDQYKEPRPFRPWFLRIVVNDSIKAARRNQRNQSLEACSEVVLDWLIDPAPGPEVLAEKDQLRREVWNALEKLSPEQRAVIVQRHFLDMEESEMARELQRPPTTIRWWLHMGRKRLKALLGTFQDRNPRIGPETESGLREEE
jgi:RNA polymerase sigma-70 factor (ECF subfamily)